MTDGAALDFNPTILAEIHRLLAGVDGLWRRHEAADRAPAAPGSLAAVDDALPQARFVRIFATQAIMASIDHLNAWRLLVDGPTIPMLAHLTLLRGSLEGAVRCQWLVDRTLDSRIRVARGFAAKRDDQIERRKFEASSEGRPRPPRTTGKTADERVADLDAARQATLDPSDVTVGIPSVRFADTTSLMVAAGYERWFRLTSGATHGKEWAYMAADLTPTTDTTPPPGVVHGIIAASEPVALALTIVSVRAAISAVADFESYVAAPAPSGRP
jgi:hypothetical protein